MIIGIDLGTTNSLVSVWESDEIKVIPNALGKFLTPSVISIDEHAILIGEPALSRMVTHPELTIANFKRYMGTDKIFKLGNNSFRPEELSSLILKRLKEDAENFLGQPVTEAVISVPAYFSDAQRKATKIAGKLAGIKVERLINEPTAAGIAYGLQEQVDDTNYMIFDLGGGTFDVSILTIFSGVIEVRASGGDNFLGGVDFTKILEEMFLDDIKKKEKFKDKIPSTLKSKIYEQAEIAKHKLSIYSEATMEVIWENSSLKYHLTDKDFENWVDPLLQRLRNPIKKVLNDSKLQPSQIHQVVLVGGASCMAVVKKMVSKMFGRLPLCHISPDTAVVQGVAVQAGLKSNEKALDEIVVTDVCPYSLGIAVSDNPVTGKSDTPHFDPIIERNTIIPASRSRLYYPIQENQTKVNIEIYQGENFFLEKNVFLGKLVLDLPIGLRDPAIEVRFTYDINGLLEVEATIQETKEKKTLVIEGNPGVLSEKQISERLIELNKIKIHPREKTENLLLLSKAERLYADSQGEVRLFLSELIKEFVAVLERQDPIAISRTRLRIESALENNQIEFKTI